MTVAGPAPAEHRLERPHAVADVPRTPVRSLGEFRIGEPLPGEVKTSNGVPKASGVARGEARRRRDMVGEQVASWLLRTGLAFVFVYAALSSFLHPATFAGYFPAFLPTSWATELLPVFAAYEVLLVVGLLSGRYTFAAAVLAALTLVGITAMNPDAFEVLFRNVAIAFAALALAVQERPRRPERQAVAVAPSNGTAPAPLS